MKRITGHGGAVIGVAVFRRSLTILGLLMCLVLFATPALADNEPYDGTDPHATGCDGSAWTPYNRTISGSGLLELRFSTSCQTAWARFTCTNTNGCTNIRFG